VVEGEKIKVSDEILSHIAQSSDGSFRDATKILEQAILEKALTDEKIKILLGRESQSAEKLLKTLSKKDTKFALEEITKMSKQGINFKFLVEDTLHLLHDLLLCQYGLENEKIAIDLKKLFTVKEITELIKLFSKVFIEMKNTSIPNLPLEVAVVEWCERMFQCNNVPMKQ